MVPNCAISDGSPRSVTFQHHTKPFHWEARLIGPYRSVDLSTPLIEAETHQRTLALIAQLAEFVGSSVRRSSFANRKISYHPLSRVTLGIERLLKHQIRKILVPQNVYSVYRHEKHRNIVRARVER